MSAPAGGNEWAERLVAEASGLRKYHEPRRRARLFALIRGLLQVGLIKDQRGDLQYPCTVEQLIVAAYPEGSAEYWRLWMDYPAENTGVTIQEFLAVHAVLAHVDELGARDRWRTTEAGAQQFLDIMAAHGEELRQEFLVRLRLADIKPAHFRRMAEYGEAIRRFVQQFREKAEKIPSLSPAVAPRAAVLALLADPDNCDLVPLPLQALLYRDLLRERVSDVSPPDHSKRPTKAAQFAEQMRKDIAAGRTTRADLLKLSEKERMARYPGCSRGTLRNALALL